MNGMRMKGLGCLAMLTALLTSPALLADEGDVTLTVAPMYGLTSGDSNTGLGGSLHLAYGVDDRFNLRATGFFGVAYLQDVDPPFALDLSFEIGFDYLITSTVAVGLAGRASVFVGEVPFDNAWLFNALFRLSFTL